MSKLKVQTDYVYSSKCSDNPLHQPMFSSHQMKKTPF
jgi:hypothetical protein